MTYAILLYIYGAGVLVFFILAAITVYHILRFGFLRAPSVVATLVFFVISVGIIVSTFAVLQDVVWSQEISISIPSLNSTVNGF